MLSFIRNESGIVSVEYVMWLPALLVILALGVDTSFLLIKQAQIYDVNREITRQLAIGNLLPEDLDATIAAVWPQSTSYVAEITEDPTFAIVWISVPFSEVMVFGNLLPDTQRLYSRVVMAKEIIS